MCREIQINNIHTQITHNRNTGSTNTLKKILHIEIHMRAKKK